jgi:hypothetical protein
VSARNAQGLDKKWLILDTTFKAYPVCGHAMPRSGKPQLHGQFDMEMVEEVGAAYIGIAAIASQPHPADDTGRSLNPVLRGWLFLKGAWGRTSFIAAAAARNWELLEIG